MPSCAALRVNAGVFHQPRNKVPKAHPQMSRLFRHQRRWRHPRLCIRLQVVQAGYSRLVVIISEIAACDTCAAHCAFMLREGKKEHLTTLTTCQDCATVCSAAAQIVARGGPFSNTICTACAEACSLCAKECGTFPGDMHMKACAEECRKCEKACRAMVKHMAS